VRRTTYNHVRVARALAPGALRTDGAVNGITVDRFVNDVYFRSVTFAVHAGAITDGEHAVTIQDSENGSDWAAAAASDVQGSLPTLTSASANTVAEIGYVGPRRYVRMVLTTSESTTGGYIDAVALLGVQPVKR
jgi:hypothetical protein